MILRRVHSVHKENQLYRKLSLTKEHSLDTIAKNLGIGNVHKHIFLCADQTKPKCCSREEGLEVWEHLKSRLRTINNDIKHNNQINHQQNGNH